MRIQQPDVSGADPLMMAGVSVSCAGTTQGIGNTQNVLRGQTLTLTPQVLVTAQTTGDVNCTVAVVARRARKTGTAAATYLVVQTGSSLQVSDAPVHTGSGQFYAPTTTSTFIDPPGEAYDAAPLEWHAPDGVTSFDAVGAIKLTACTATGGSDDPYDVPDGGDLCKSPRTVIPGGSSDVRVVFSVWQRGEAAGTYCNQLTIPAMLNVHISDDVHHKMVYGQGRVDVLTSGASGQSCSRDFRIKIYVKHLAGASVMVPRQGTMTAAILV